MSLSWITTITICSAIIVVFVYFLVAASKLLSIVKTLKASNENVDMLSALEESALRDLAIAYKKTITIRTEHGDKSNIPASEIFTEFSAAKCRSVNLRMLDTGGGTLVGLGLFGTFLGLTIGIATFDSSNTENIQSSIQGLLGGMGTAFATSLFGMLLSLVYIAFDKSWRNKMGKAVFDLSEKLDEKYYIDDIALSTLRQKELMDNLYNRIVEMMEIQGAQQVDAINEIKSVVDSQLTYTDNEGNKSTTANALREILAENQQQSKALSSFSTDLAIELNNGFDEVLSRQMQAKIIPLMENVNTTTQSIVEHIDQMAIAVASPATDMLQVVVQELKSSMAAMVDEFRSGLSNSATAELEKLAMTLGSATEAMGNFPSTMENISATLQVTIEEVKSAVSEITNTSANANSTAMKQMQEQISMATSAINNAILQVKDVMSGMSTSTQEQSAQMVSKLSDAADKMKSFLDETVASLSSSVRASVKDMSENITLQQTDLIALQEDTTETTKKLLDSFNSGLDRLEKMNEYIAGTMNQFSEAQGHINGSTAHLQTITGDMKLATQLFQKGQTEYASTLSSLQTSSQRGIDAIAGLLKQSGEMSSQYVSDFDLIKQGLAGIFGEIQEGLKNYSLTVKSSTQEYLDKYTTSLTNTTDALASTIQQQSEIAEMLADAVKIRR